MLRVIGPSRNMNSMRLKWSRSTSYRRWSIAVVPFCLSLLLASCGVARHPGMRTVSPIPAPKNKPSWKLAWQDDFNGRGIPANWIFDTGGYGFGDRQLQWNSNSNARLSGHGDLILTAEKGGSDHICWYGPCKYTAVTIQTTFAQAYGRFEARIKLPSGTGLWPAFWMIPADLTKNGSDGVGEIDILEANNRRPNVILGYAHSHGGSNRNYRTEKVLDASSSSQYHIYGVDWTPAGITWTFDGQSYGHINSYPKWPFNRPFIILLSLAVGGNWPGPPSASTVFPAHMLVSWIRVYKEARLARA